MGTVHHVLILENKKKKRGEGHHFGVTLFSFICTNLMLAPAITIGTGITGRIRLVIFARFSMNLIERPFFPFPHLFPAIIIAQLAAFARPLSIACLFVGKISHIFLAGVTIACADSTFTSYLHCSVELTLYTTFNVVILHL